MLKPHDGAADALDMDPQEELATAYEEYRSAMRGWRAAAKAGHADTAERAAERLLRARVDLYRSLLATGWTAPGPVGVQLERDAALVAAPTDFDALLSV